MSNMRLVREGVDRVDSRRQWNENAVGYLEYLLKSLKEIE